ncbi:MAG: amidohydrolase [Propionibacteriales bacterium]|nr:amidohydrolase [Propionibacteriales bacterium]
MIIDIHGHITHPELLRRYPMPPSLGDIEGMLDRKSAAGIALTIVGSPVGFGTMTRLPGVDNYSQSDDQLAAFHEWLAETVRAHEGRLRAYVYCDPFSGERGVEAARQRLAQREFVGLIVNTSVRGTFLDDPRANDLFAMAAEANAPILLHPPAEPAGSATVGDFRLAEQVARFNDVTLGLAAILVGGRLDRHPSLKIIGATGGGAIAFLSERLDLAHAPRHWGKDVMTRQTDAEAARPPSASLPRLFVDTACHNRLSLAANVEVLGPSQVMFGTDSPPIPTSLETQIGAIIALGLDDGDRAAVLYANAERVFGLKVPSPLDSSLTKDWQ